METKDSKLYETTIDEMEDNGFYSKFAILMKENIKFGKNIMQTTVDDKITRRAIEYTFDVNADKLGKSFYDAYVITYLPYITKRYKDKMENEEIEDIYGNRITFVFEGTVTIFIKPNVTAELEKLYDELNVEVLEKVHTYGEDMEISR